MDVLIVDDEMDILILVAAFLKREGIRSTLCSTVTDAKQKLSDGKYDFYLLDINLPDGLGTELAKHIYNTHEAASIALMSAYEDALEDVDMEALPILAYIQKPFTQKQLLSVVQNKL